MTDFQTLGNNLISQIVRKSLTILHKVRSVEEIEIQWLVAYRWWDAECWCCDVGILYFISATVNPLLYNLMSGKYRAAFRDTLCQCCCFFSPSHQQQRMASSMYYRGRRTVSSSRTRSALSDHAMRSASVLMTLANRSVTFLPPPDVIDTGRQRTSSASSYDEDFSRSNSLKRYMRWS